MNVNIPPVQPPIVSKPYNAASAAYTVNPAMAAAMQTATVTRTQTVQAPAPVYKAEAPRRAMSSTETGQSVDTTAQAISSRTSGGGAAKGRGSLVDIRA
ncbi:hypothetical protein JL101_019645 [Skermanella rosea]|uniref:hypothetical protein n=1 Tax=Skermanella rosea TaxID=1817965 RepID=UPI0019347CB3|nr:hypothetical protein [Skermanella rosea]UEM02200.1 hypothetical protein JL101_019645 [Skermanella rosea]